MLKSLQRGLSTQLSRYVLKKRAREFQRALRTERDISSFAKNSQEVASSGWQKPHYLWLGIPAAAAAALGTSYTYQEQQAWHPQSETGGHTACQEVAWVRQLAAQPSNELVLSAASMQNHPLLSKDHMTYIAEVSSKLQDMQFSELHRHRMVEDLVCYYSVPQQRLNYVIQLGKNVCGFPRIMHGGLTAAILDESFGFLWLALRGNGQLPFRGPAFTAHLEVDYKKKISAGQLLLCTTEVEVCQGRKLWMKATLSDGPSGKVYATARALFVCPRPQKLLGEGVKYAYHSLFH